MSRDFLGWDIGGAHLKLARIENGCLVEVRQVPCALWRGLDELRNAVSAAGLHPAPRHAVTMTGELVDFFPDRASGVAAIIGALSELVPINSVRIYASDGEFLPPDEALAAPAAVASANWHATAKYAALRLSSGVLVDIGSTTTDLVPFYDGRPAARGSTDVDRLATGELVYTGVVRTPLAAVSREVPFGGRKVAVMAELFATMADAYRVLGTLPADADLHPAADGRGKSVEESRARLARMIGMDEACASGEAWRLLAEAFANEQMRQIEAGLELVLSAGALPRSAPIVGAGVGRFLASELARRSGRDYAGFETLVPLETPELAPIAAAVAPAVSVALLLDAAEA